VHDERRRDFWANPIVPTWYSGSVGVLDLDGQPVATREQEESSTEKDAAGPRVKVGADGLGIIIED